MPGPDGLLRCPRALSATEYLAYHDNEWGRPVTSVQGLAPLSGVADLLAGWTLMGVAFLLLGVVLLLLGAALLGCVAALLVGWTLVGVPFLLFGVALLRGGVAALLAGWTPVGVVFLLLGIAALLGGVALLYRPESPRRLVAWPTKQDDLPLTPDGNERDWPDGATPRSPEVVSRVVAGGGERNVVLRAMACVSAPVRQPSHM
jgi:hypothetical protein